ncbi:MAG: hypothetical protein HYZ58_01685 [Acidobacteria bacterium]|nr:hypothetical protein [Acidobacteriota bacterium]
MAPELAILGVLEAVIDLAIISLVAAQPELHERGGGHVPLMTAPAESADHVIAQAQALAAAILGYRLTRRHERDNLPL